MRILALDPSVNFCGWAVSTGDHSTSQYRLGTITPRENNLWHTMENIYYDLLEVLDEQTPDQIVVEWPTFFSSAKGQIAAQKGYTINLAAIDSYIVGRFGLSWENVFHYTPEQWKGSVPKSKTEKMFRMMFGTAALQGIDNNAIDACMMLVEHNRRHA